MASVPALIKYLGCPSPRPRADSEDPSRSVLPTVEVSVLAHDARDASTAPRLDVQGFALFAHESRVTDFDDADQLEATYLPEVEELVRTASGASRAWALPRPVLRSERHSSTAGLGVVRDVPAPVAHIDYSAGAIPALVAAASERRGERSPSWKRFVLYTVWRSLRPPPQDRPLAVCDLRTVEKQDLVPSDAIANPGALAHDAEFLMLLANARHEWRYFADMLPNEALIFQQLDSASAGPSGCPHTSFAMPGSEAAAPRLSIEARVCAFFE